MSTEYQGPASGASPHSLQDEEFEIYNCADTPEIILQRNPFDFDACSELIDHFLFINDSQQARHFREHAACFCATTDEFWIDWVSDEIENDINKNQDDEQQSRSIIQLYKRAITAVPQVEVWLDYLKFLKAKRFQAGSTFISNAVIRRACEHSIRELGLHATEGPKLWSCYRHFEVHLLTKMLEQSDGSISIDPNTQTSFSMISTCNTTNTESPSAEPPANVQITPTFLKSLSIPSPQFYGQSTPHSSLSPRLECTMQRHQSDPLTSSETPSISECSVDSRLLLPTPRAPIPHLDIANRISQQVIRIRNLFSRQMVLPLAGLPDLFDEYRIFEAELPERLQATESEIQYMKTQYQEQGMVEWDLRKPFEMQLNDTDGDKFETLQKLSDAWTNYIAFEKSLNHETKNHERVHITYLRACEDLGHIRLDLWFQWIDWVVDVIQDSGRGAIIYDRAVRYHPEESRLWLGYLQCQLRKTSHPDPDRIRQVFVRGLRGLSRQRPEELLEFAFMASDCLWKCIQTKKLIIVTNEQQQQQQQPELSTTDAILQTGNGDNRQSSPNLGHVNEIKSVNNKSTRQISSFDPPSIDHDDLNFGFVRDVFIRTERQLLGILFMDENEKPFKTKNGITVQDSDIFSGLLTLWDQWCRFEAELLKSYEWIERVGCRLLVTYSLSQLKRIIIPVYPHDGSSEDTIDTSSIIADVSLLDLETLNRLSLTSSDNLCPFGNEWTQVLDRLQMLIEGPDGSELRELYQIGHRSIKTQPESFYKSWEKFEQKYGTLQQQENVSLLKQSCKLDQNINEYSSHPRLVIPTEHPLLTYKTALESEIRKKPMDENCSTTTPSEQLPTSDSEVVNVTLGQLRFRRVKRRRRLSESETDTFSDASSDSGGFINVSRMGQTTTSNGRPLSPLSAPLNPRKRRRSSASIISNRSSTQSTYQQLTNHGQQSTSYHTTSVSTSGDLPTHLSPSFSPLNNRPTWLTMAGEVEENEIMKAAATARESDLFYPPRSTSTSPIPSRRSSRSGATSRTRSNSSTSESSPVASSQCVTVSPLTPSEIDAIEKAARATWDGHECSDPSTAPAVPPITSLMSPIRRRSRINSFIQMSPLSLSSEAAAPNSIMPLQEDTVPPSCPPQFRQSGLHLAPLDEDKWSQRVGMKRSKNERSIRKVDSYKRVKKDDSNEVMEIKAFTPPVPRKGKHFLQLRQTEGEMMQDAQDVEGAEELMHHEEESFTVFVTNLDNTVNEETIRKLFKDCEGLKEVRIVRDFMKRSKGFCYVDFNTPEEAKLAVDKVQGAIINERLVRIQMSRPTVAVYEPKTLFLSNLPLDLEDQIPTGSSVESFISDAIRAISERVVGITICPVEIRLNRHTENGRLKGYGYVDFDLEDDAKAMLHIQSEELDLPGNRGLFVLTPSIPMKRHRWSIAPDNRVEKRHIRERKIIESSIPKPEPQTLFIKNLSFKTSEKSLKKHFDSCGEIDSVMICRNEDGKSKGFGFVTFSDPRSAFSGRMLDQTELEGREITVSQSYRVPTHPKEHVEKLSERCRRSEAPKVKLALHQPPNEEQSNVTMEQSKPLTNADFRQLL